MEYDNVYFFFLAQIKNFLRIDSLRKNTKRCFTQSEIIFFINSSLNFGIISGRGWDRKLINLGFAEMVHGFSSLSVSTIREFKHLCCGAVRTGDVQSWIGGD